MTSNAPVLAPFALEHAAGVVAVIRSVFEEYGMTFDLEDWDADLQDIVANYAGRGGCFFVLLEDDRVIGTVGAVPVDATTCELKRLYVSPTHRGGRHGRRLIEQTLTWAADEGFRSVTLWSDVRFDTAHEVYRRLGFRQIGERTVEDIDRSREYGFTLDLPDPARRC